MCLRHGGMSSLHTIRRAVSRALESHLATTHLLQKAQPLQHKWSEDSRSEDSASTTATHGLLMSEENYPDFVNYMVRPT